MYHDPGPPPTFFCIPSDSTPVNSYTEDLIYPSDTVPAELVCFNQCPDPTKINSEDPFNDYSSPQLAWFDAEALPPEWVPVLPLDSRHATYTFDKQSMQLMSGTNPVVATNSSQKFQFGKMSGPLFDPTHLNLLECKMIYDPSNPFDPDSTCGWKAWNDLSEYYTWETGPNSWNQFAALKDRSRLFKFEPPLLVSYDHEWDDHSTSRFYLEYSGFGNLRASLANASIRIRVKK